MFIDEEELKYFKIKEGKDMFHKLIDVAVQAKKDKVISSQLVIFSDSVHYFDEQRNSISHFARNAEEGIEKIKSLYTETFKVESKEDCRRIKVGATVRLCNRVEFKRVDPTPTDSLLLESKDGERHSMKYPILKGAVVIQLKARESHDV